MWPPSRARPHWPETERRSSNNGQGLPWHPRQALAVSSGVHHSIREMSRRRRTMMRFSNREMYDCEMPIRSATSFCVFSLRPPSP